MTSYGFDENFDLDYENNGNQGQSGQKNMFSSLMDPSGQRKAVNNEFPDFDAPSGQHDTPWDSEDVWGEQPKTANNPYGGFGGGFGADFSALRGTTKPQERPKPFHMDSMELSNLEKEDNAYYSQGGYAGQEVLNQSVKHEGSDVALSRQQSRDYNPQAGNGGGQSPYGGQSSPAYQEEHKDDSMTRSQKMGREGHGPSRFKDNNPIQEDEGEYNRQEEPQQQWENHSPWNRSESNIQQQNSAGMNQQYGGDPWQNQNQNQNQNQGSGQQSPAYGYNQNAGNNEPYSGGANQSGYGHEQQQQQHHQEYEQPNSGNLRPQQTMQRTDTNERLPPQQQRNEWEDQNIHVQKQTSFGNNQSEPASGAYGGTATTFADTGNFGNLQPPGKSSVFEWEDTSHYFQDKPKKPEEPVQPARDTHEDEFATYRTNQSVAEPAREPASNYNSNNTQNYQTPVTDTYRSGVSQLHSPYSEDRMFVGGQHQSEKPGSVISSPPNTHLNRADTSSFRPKIVEVQNENVSSTGQPATLNSLNIEPKGIQKPRKPKAPTNIQEVQTEDIDGEPKMVSVHTQSPKKGGRPSMAGNPRALGNDGDTLDILCSVHEGQYIERICTHQRYKKKRLICWECGMDESKEIQKYRHSLVPITQYALQNLEEYSKREGPAVPEDLKKSLATLESMKEMYSQDISVNTTDLKRSLEVMKRQILEKFEEINQTIDDLAHKKVGGFDINRNFFRHTLDTYYPDNSKQKVSASVLYDTLKHIQTENEFQDFVKSLKPEVDPSAPEIKNYLRVLSHKIDTQELKLPNRDHFAQIHNKNLKVIQLQEQILTNLDGVKTSLTELINTSYQVEDITKTRIVTPKSLTQDTLATLAPINKISNELVRYRLQFEKKLSTPESKSITCIANIDNEIIAAGAMDKTITFWRISTSEILDTIVGHDDAISGLYTYQVCMSDLKSRVPQTNNFNEDAVTLLVSTGGKFDNSILFWDISWMHDYIRGKIQTKQQTKLIRRLEGHESGATAVLPMSDGATLISGAYDGKITVWNVLKSKVIGEIQHHTSAVSCLRLMRCNERYASASWDKTICIWKIFYKDLYDPETGIHSDRRLFEGFEMEKIIDPSFKIMCMNASLVKKNWLVFGGSINRVIVWDVDEGRLVKEFECENNNLTDVLLVEDEQKEKMILLGVCNDDDVVRGWDTNFQETEGLIREAYNIKNKKRLYINKASINGALLRFVEDGRLRMASVNCANNKDLISLWDVQLGI